MGEWESVGPFLSFPVRKSLGNPTGPVLCSSVVLRAAGCEASSPHRPQAQAGQSLKPLRFQQQRHSREEEELL